MDTSLQSLCWFVKRTPGVSWIGSRAGLEAMVKKFPRLIGLVLGIWKIPYGIANGLPRLSIWPGRKAHGAFQQPGGCVMLV